MSELDQPKSPLDRALETLNSDWQTCTFNITFSGLATADQIGVLGLQLGLNIMDTGSQVIFTRSNGDGFNQQIFGDMLRHYFNQFPDMAVVFAEAKQNGT